MKSRSFFLWTVIALAMATFCAPRQARAVDFLITYGDAAGTGFKDPVLGPQRRIAFEAAVSYWKRTLTGKVPIEILANFESMGGDAEGAPLAGARPLSTRANFTGAPLKNSQYPIALANQLAGFDLAPAPGTVAIPRYDIEASFNADVDTDAVLGVRKFYYGLDSNPPILGTGPDGTFYTDLDFYSTALHEIAHGLGFYQLLAADGTFFGDVPSVFDRFLTNGISQTSTRLTSLTEERRVLALVSDRLFFAGPAARRAEGSGFNTRLFAPLAYEPGSSTGHLDENTYHGINELMTPYDSQPINQAGPITLGIMADVGWSVIPSNPIPLPSSTPAPTAPPSLGRIAYSSGGDIYVINADGTGKRRIITGASVDSEPTISFNGDKIVFVSNRDNGDLELYMVNTVGTGLQRLTASPGEDSEPSFRRDGAAIVFTSNRTGNKDVYVMTLATGVVRNLTAASLDDDFQPAFSSSGRTVAFSSVRSGNAEIYVMPVDGTVATRLTTDAANVPSEDTQPSFNRAGDTIAFTSTRDGNQEIYTIPTLGGTATRVTANIVSDAFPQFSPFENKIVFQSDLLGKFDIWTVTRSATGVVGARYRLTSDLAVNVTPSWGGANDVVLPTPTPTPISTSSPTPTATPTPVEPANNDFVNAKVIAGSSGTINGSNVKADRETGEPIHANVVGKGSIWYRWTAPTSGQIVFSTSGSSFDTTLAVYTGTAVNALTLVASNDDDGKAMTSRLQFDAVVGNLYYIAVDGFGIEMGAVKLTWSPGLANDNFENATFILNDSGVANGTNVGATKENGEPTIASTSGGASVWYRWTAPSSGQVIFDTRGSTFDTLLGAYQGTTVASLATVATNNNESTSLLTSRIAFNAVAGNTYYIVVDGVNGTTGNIVLNWTLAAGVVRPDALLGLNGAFVGDNVYNATGVGQQQNQTVAPGSTATYTLQVQNDGTQSDTIRVTGSSSPFGATVRYFAGTTDITNQVIAGGYLTPTLAAGGSALIRVTVTLGGFASTGFNASISMTAAPSSLSSSVTDVVQAITTAGSTSTIVAKNTNVIALSTARALANVNEIELRFMAPLDANAASDSTHYVVAVNNQIVAIESAGYVASRNMVRLSLPLGTLKVGDNVQVAWNELRDSRGNIIAAGKTVLTAH